MIIQYHVKNVDEYELPIDVEEDLDKVINCLLEGTGLSSGRHYKLHLYKNTTNPHKRLFTKGELDITFNCRIKDKVK